MDGSDNPGNKIILFSNRVKKQLRSGFGLRFLAGSGPGFNEYGSETLIFFLVLERPVQVLRHQQGPHHRTGIQNPAGHGLLEKSDECADGRQGVLGG